MVVSKDDPRCAVRDGQAEHFARMDEGAIQGAERHFLQRDHAGLRAQQNGVEAFDQLAARAWVKQRHHVLRPPHVDGSGLRRVRLSQEPNPFRPQLTA